MLGEDEINEALMRIGQMEQFGPSASQYLEDIGYDPEAVFQASIQNAKAMARMGIIDPRIAETCSITFGMGFLLAAVLQQMEKERSNA